ncbi:Pepco domain-containing protein [Lentzea sp. HUAS TT2]|uniref:Pepco domain-containing protein n=1 Tax=Lentzea sp. HUAS TT2 TaxID=3447454 RepID=UPI003F71BD40
MADDVIRIFSVEDDGDDDDRGLFKRADDLRYGRSEIPVDEFRLRVAEFVSGIENVIQDIAATAGEYDLDEVQVAVEVSAKGSLSLLGTGGELAGKGAMTFKFKKRGQVQEVRLRGTD